MSSTPTLAGLLESFIGDALLGTNIAVPAIMRSYDSDTREASVQVVINKETPEGFGEFPIIQGVPVVQLGGRSAGISIPFQSGDMVLLVFSQKSLDAWLDSATGEPTDPRDTRVNSIQDAVAIPGIFPFSMAPTIAGASTDLVITNDIGGDKETTISLKGDGTISITSTGKVTIDAPNIDLGTGGAFIARVGDTVDTAVTLGVTGAPWDGALGTGVGTITTGSSKNKSA